jgi:hypothetical protein
MNPTQNDARQVFKEKGTCSQTFGYLLNREFDQLTIDHEKALDPLAGGILRYGHQCGILWGATLGVSRQAHQKYTDENQARAAAINATREIMSSFENETQTHNCRTITRTNFRCRLAIFKFLFTGRHKYCFNLTEKWAPESLQVAHKGLENTNDHGECVSCASETIIKMGGTPEEAAMVSGFAGGLGLSGQACGALSAAIWYKALKWQKQNPDKKSSYNNSDSKEVMKKFLKQTGKEFSCEKICGQKFDTVKSHTEYIKNGGCKEIIEVLAS